MGRGHDLLGAACGVAAPAAFVGAWLVAGARRPGYDPLVEAISQLAREGTASRPLMTTGFVAFGVLLPAWAPTLASHLPARGLRATVATAGLTTLAVAALPLAREPGGLPDALHAATAGTGYLAMALTPLIAAPVLRRRGHRVAAALSVAVGVVSAGSLVGTLLVGDGGLVGGRLGSGGLQRLGLTVVDLWHVAAAGAVARAALRAGRR